MHFSNRTRIEVKQIKSHRKGYAQLSKISGQCSKDQRAFQKPFEVSGKENQN